MIIPIYPYFLALHWCSQSGGRKKFTVMRKMCNSRPFSQGGLRSCFKKRILGAKVIEFIDNTETKVTKK